MSSPAGPRPARAADPVVALAGIAALLGAPEPAVDVLLTGVTHDSGDVRPGDLFAALPGARHHGAEFAAAAVGSGAVAVLTDEAGLVRSRDAGVPVLVVPDPRGVLGVVAAEVYGRPAEHLLVLGVTGTNGKTTTVHMLDAALVDAGRRPGLVGTIETRVGDEVFASVRTTPESTDLEALLAVMVERGADSVAMEVSSIAMSMGRVDGLHFDVVGFTNLSQDHLDFHADMDAYFAAKAALFTPEHARAGVVVVDDEHGRALAASAAIPVTTVSVDGHGADWQATSVTRAQDGVTTYTAVVPGGERIESRVLLPGRFNVANALLAAAMLTAAGAEPARALAGVATCTGVPGRMEAIHEGQAFAAVVDYAHTPGAVTELVRALRETSDGRILLVLGCGGDRDAAKRPLMGEAGARGADVLVVTDDNPRSEAAATIRAAMVAGAEAVPASERAEVVEIADRADAVRAVVGRAEAGDVVVVAGKGHEQGQEVAGTVTPFDDRAVLRAVIGELMSR